MEAGTLHRSGTAGARAVAGPRRLVTETKASIKTSEFWLTIAVIAGILISAALIKGGDTGGTDEFIGRQAWLYVAIVAGAYSVGRGLAKSGSNEPYFADRDGTDRGNAGGRDDRNGAEHGERGRDQFEVQTIDGVDIPSSGPGAAGRVGRVRRMRAAAGITPHADRRSRLHSRRAPERRRARRRARLRGDPDLPPEPARLAADQLRARRLRRLQRGVRRLRRSDRRSSTPST